jgi:hypothetical protein
MVYGIHKSDTLEMNVDYPLLQTSTLVPTSDLLAQFSPHELTVGRGGVVLFVNDTDKPTDIIFDDSTAAQSATYAQIAMGMTGIIACIAHYTCPVAGSSTGNILALPPLDTLKKHRVGFDFRRFPTPGTYPFQSQSSHATGIIHVE